MAQLTAGMYGSEFRNTSDLFGLHSGQMRSGHDKITHNSGWYNRSGERLGWGDLSSEDFKQISKGLEINEFFIILSEMDSHWNFTGGKPKEGLPEEVPGIDYVVQKSMYIITSENKFFLVDKHGLEKEVTSEKYGLSFKILKRREVEVLVKNSMLP